MKIAFSAADGGRSRIGRLDRERIGQKEILSGRQARGSGRGVRCAALGRASVPVRCERRYGSEKTPPTPSHAPSKAAEGRRPERRHRPPKEGAAVSGVASGWEIKKQVQRGDERFAILHSIPNASQRVCPTVRP